MIADDFLAIKTRLHEIQGLMPPGGFEVKANVTIEAEDLVALVPMEITIEKIEGKVEPIGSLWGPIPGCEYDVLIRMLHERVYEIQSMLRVSGIDPGV